MPHQQAETAVHATILAAGLGRRLGGQAKAALTVAGTSLMERLVGGLHEAGVARVQVILGPYTEVLLPLVERSGAIPVLHGRATTTLIESQRLALQTHRQHAPGRDAMLVLADLPWLTAEHIAPLLASWQARATGIHAQLPVVGGVRGHPLILSAQALEGILATPESQGVRHWLSAHPDQVGMLDMPHAAYITDIDTPEDWAAFQRQFAQA